MKIRPKWARGVVFPSELQDFFLSPQILNGEFSSWTDFRESWAQHGSGEERELGDVGLFFLLCWFLSARGALCPGIKGRHAPWVSLLQHPSKPPASLVPLTSARPVPPSLSRTSFTCPFALSPIRVTETGHCSGTSLALFPSVQLVTFPGRLSKEVWFKACFYAITTQALGILGHPH